MTFLKLLGFVTYLGSSVTKKSPTDFGNPLDLKPMASLPTNAKVHKQNLRQNFLARIESTNRIFLQKQDLESLTMEKVALKPDHLLMDPDFEGYKLSLDPVPVHSTKLESPLEVRNAGDDQVLNKDDIQKSLFNLDPAVVAWR